MITAVLKMRLQIVKRKKKKNIPASELFIFYLNSG